MNTTQSSFGSIDSQSLPFSTEKQKAIVAYVLRDSEFADVVLPKISSKWFSDLMVGKLFGIIKDLSVSAGSLPTTSEIVDSMSVSGLDHLTRTQIVALAQGLSTAVCPYKSEGLLADMTVWAQSRTLQIELPKAINLFNLQKFDEANAAMLAATEMYTQAKMTDEEDLMAPVDCEALRAEARALPAERYVVDQLVCASGIELVVGPSNAGKSWMGQYIAQCAVAQGRDVLFIEEEGDKRSMGKRFDLFDIKGVQMCLNGGYKLTNPAHVNKIKKWVASHKNPVIIMDPLIALHSGDENSSKEMTEVMEALKTILRAKNKESSDCLVVVLHHVAKSKSGGNDDGKRSGIDQSRGSSSIPAAADHQLNVEGVKQEEGAKKVVINVTVTKNRNGERWQTRTITFNLDGSHRIDVERNNGESTIVNSISGPVLDCLSEGQKTFKEIRTAVGKKESVVKDIVRKMIDQGVIQTHMEGRTLLYSIPESGSVVAKLNELV